MWRLAHPKLIIISAPSGAGKSTLCNRLLAEASDILYSVSCTTRSPRGAEVDGEAYHFLDVADFERRIQANDFLEHARVHGNYYGTLRSSVAEALSAGHSLIMDIDVQGAAQIRAALSTGDDHAIGLEQVVDVFIAPPSIEVLAKRLHGRGEDAPEVIAQRLRNAESEMAAASAYSHVVVNDDLERAARELYRILDAEGQCVELSGGTGS
jgi:guanylate kinase